MKMKKYMLAAGTLASIGAPIAAVISCGGGGGISRYETDNDGKLRIATTFSASGKQMEALEEIAKVYNAWITANNKKVDGHMPIEIESVSGGYGAAAAALRKKFGAKDKKTVANMIMDYPGSASILESYKMGLDLKDVLSATDLTALKGRFEEDFIGVNDKIGGVKKGSVVSIPISVSSTANAINTPFLAYAIKEINRLHPGTIDITTNSTVKTLYDQGAASAGDVAAIAIKWGTMKAFDVTKAGTLTDATFNEWDSLIKWATEVQKGFAKDVKNSDSLHVLALDSPTNVIQLLSYAYADGDMSKFYIVKNSDGYVDFKFLTDKNSESYKSFKKGMELLRGGVASGAVWIGGLGSYGSSLLINHQSMFSLGSTAGATHWYADGSGTYVVKDGNGGSVKAKAGDLKVKGETITTPSKTIPSKNIPDQIKAGRHANDVKASSNKQYDYVIESGKSLADISIFTPSHGSLYLVKDASKQAFETEFVGKFIKLGIQFGTSKTLYGVLKADEKATIATANVTKVEFVAAHTTQSKTIPAKTETLTESTFTDTRGNYTNKLVTANAGKHDVTLSITEAQLLAHKKAGFTALVSIPTAGVAKFESKNSGNFKEVASTSKSKYYVVKPSLITHHTANESLQVKEMHAIGQPTKIKGNQNGGVYIQGPSIITVHANKAEDKAVALFIQWFTDQTAKHSFEGKTTTATEYWMQKASYIVPLKGAFKTGSAIDQLVKKNASSKYWKGSALVWQMLNKAANSNGKLKPIIGPVDDFTSLMRNDVTDPLIKGMFTDAHVSGKVASLDAIYKEMKAYAKNKHIL